MAGLLACIFILVSLQEISATQQQNYLQDETQQTLQTLNSLPSHCTKDLNSLILSKQRKLPGQVLYCSIASIVIDLAEVFVDTSFFGFEAYEEVPALLKDLKNLRKCLDETTTEEIVACAALNLPGTVQALNVVGGGLENYVGEMQMIVPLLVDEIEQCRNSSLSKYRAYLESVLEKATTCAQ